MTDFSENQEKVTKRHGVIIPLQDGLKKILRNDLTECANVEEILALIEQTLLDSTDDEAYANLTEALTSNIGPQAKYIVSKIFIYKKKPCRDGSQCAREDCIFRHDARKKMPEEIPTKRRENFDSVTKKYKSEENMSNTGVICNRVNESVYEITQLKDFASNYGNVINIKRLNPGKYLVTYEKPEEARNLVYTTEYVLGDPEIKKYYNIMEWGQTQKGINAILQEQEDLMDKLTVYYDQALVASIKNVNQKIKSYILSSNCDSKESSNEKKDNASEKKFSLGRSYYFNSF